jgi:hypothetical protein
MMLMMPRPTWQSQPELLMETKDNRCRQKTTLDTYAGVYHTCVQVSADEASAGLARAQSHLPPLALRSALMSASGSAEMFLANRLNYTR